jgi:asparagine synthase (glutamine-hydrolysing)
VLPRNSRFSLPGDKLHKLADVLACSSSEDMYQGLVSHWSPESVVLGAAEPPTVLTDRYQWANIPDITQRMMFLDSITYLPDDILTKVDRASMAVSLETRIPMLDHRVAELAWRVPRELKIRGGEAKWILRKVLYRYVPEALVDRPKMGFGVPVDRWLRGPLREWAEELLNETRIRREQYFNPALVGEKWREHLSGKRNWAYHLWDVLMFEAWLDSQSKTGGHDSLEKFELKQVDT